MGPPGTGSHGILGSLVSKLSIKMPYLVDQIKNSIAIGKIKSVERAKIKNQSL